MAAWLAGAAFAHAASLGAGTFVPAGQNPFSVVAGDFNGDGRVDLAAGDMGLMQVLLFLGDGLGGMTPAGSYPVDCTWCSLAVGDVNGDGTADIAVATGRGSLELLLGDGAAHFARASLPLAEPARAIALADLDGDRDLDVILASHPVAWVLLGDGSGGFRPGPLAPVSVPEPMSIAVGDVNGDRIPDAVVAGQGLTVLTGDGHGGLEWSAHAMGGMSVVIRDLDGDGNVDLASPTWSFGLAISFGDGTGHFGPPARYPGVTEGTGIAAADFDGDGRVDLLAGVRGHSAVLFLGEGDGKFRPARRFGVGYTPTGVAAADFDTDGLADAAVANVNGGGLTLLLGESDGTLRAARSAPTGAVPTAVAIADLDGDGFGDLVVANSVAASVSVFRGDASGGMTPLGGLAVGQNPSRVVVRDWNGDGKLDLAVLNNSSNSVTVALGDGTGQFGSRTDYPVGVQPSALAVADLNGDGSFDLVVRNYVGPKDFTVLLGDGTGGFLAGPEAPAGAYGQQIASGDFNRDGLPDLVLYSPSTLSLDVLLGDGTGRFPDRLAHPAGSDVLDLAVGDFDGDGNMDVAVALFFSNSVALLRGDGTGALTIESTVDVGMNPWRLAGGDFDGSGRVGLLVTGWSVTTSVLLSWSSPGGLHLDERYDMAGTGLGVGDVDGDGKADVALTMGIRDDQVDVVLSMRTSDLAIAMQASGSTVAGISTAVYTITVTNAGPDAARAVRVRDALPSWLHAATWTCSPSPGTSCTEGGSGDIADSVALPVGGSVTYTLTARVRAEGAGRGARNRAHAFRGLRASDLRRTDNAAAAAVPMILVPGLRVIEGGPGVKTVRVPVLLSAPFPGPVTVGFATADGTARAGTDYRPASGTVTLSTGLSKQEILISVVGDGKKEPTEAFFVALGPSNGAILRTSQAVVTIVDDDR